MEQINEEKSTQEQETIDLSDSMDNLSALLTHAFIPMANPIGNDELAANIEMVDAVRSIIEQAEDTDESHEMQNNQRSRMTKPVQRSKTPTRARSTARKTRSKPKTPSMTRSTAKKTSKSRSSSAGKAKPKSRKSSRGRSNSRRRY